MMEAMFKKEDIKAGYLLRWEGLGDGETFYTTVLPCAGGKVHPFLAFLVGDAVVNREDGALACCGDGEYWPLSAVQDDLRIVGKKGWQCVEIWGYTAPKFLLANSTRMRELLWKRNEGSGCCRGDGECRCGEDRSAAAEGPGTEATADPFRGECGATESREENEGRCNETGPVVMTIDEISRALGYPVLLADEATACGGDSYAE